jgi:hypothetical protein
LSDERGGVSVAAAMRLFLITAAFFFAAGCVPVAPDAPPAISYFIEDGTGVPGFDPHDGELAEWALADWARASGSQVRFVRAASAADATFRVRWISPYSGLYGEMERVMVQGRPGAIINVSPAGANLGEPFAGMAKEDRLFRDTIVYLTCVHESGHALGLEHTRNFDDIMYAFGYGGDIVEYFSRYRRRLQSRADIPHQSALSPNDIAALAFALGRK